MIHIPTYEEHQANNLTLDHANLPVLSTDDVISSISKNNKEFLLYFMKPENFGRYR